MDRRQVSAFKKMLGKPFDVSLLTPGPFRGGARPGAAANGSDASKSASATAKSDSAKPDTKSSAASKPAGTPRRQSLRERRGLGQQPAQGDSPN
jgi:hypothetical protein